MLLLLLLLLLLLRLLPNIAFPDKVVVVHAVHGSEPNDMMQSGAAVEDMKSMLDDDGIILCFYDLVV